MACAEGATAIGFNFYPRSPRYIAPERAAGIRTAPGVRRVGVFVNEAREDVERIARVAGLDVVQLHGNERPADCPASLTVWKARAWRRASTRPVFWITPSRRCCWMARPANATRPELRVAPGGTHCPQRVILAGGLDGSNVAEAIAGARPWGVDACSCIESAPGKKDPLKMTEFLNAAREAFRQ